MALLAFTVASAAPADPAPTFSSDTVRTGTVDPGLKAPAPDAASALGPRAVSFREAVAVWLRGAVAVEEVPGGIRYRDCYAVEAWQDRLAGNGWGADRLRVWFDGFGSHMNYALAMSGVRAQFESLVASHVITGDLKEAYIALVLDHLEALEPVKPKIAAAVTMAGFELGEGFDPGSVGSLVLDDTCTTGPCDCGVCPPGRVCDCKKSSGKPNYDCAAPRSNCSTDDPKTATVTLSTPVLLPY